MHLHLHLHLHLTRCGRPAGNASYSQRVQRTVAQRKLRLALDPAARHIYICDQHKDMIQVLHYQWRSSTIRPVQAITF